MQSSLKKSSLVLFISAIAVAGAANAVTLEEKVEILTQEVEELKQQRGQQPAADKAVLPDAAAAEVHGSLSESRVVGHGAGSAGKTRVGGYGELHFNNLENQQTGVGKDEIDFHRFIIFLGHSFTDRMRFFSELEFEHSLVKDNGDATCADANADGIIQPGECTKSNGKGPGEIELEQAFIEFDLGERAIAQAGLFVLPVGIINETHEPPTFYGVERNPVETNIIPTTWWEGGGQMIFRLPAGLSANVAYTSGLKVGSDFSIRGGRQKVASAVANDPAYSARLKWTGIPGLEVAGTVVYQKDIGQGLVAGLEDATLLETHVVFSKGPFALRALYATWDLNGAAPKAVGADEQTGYYVEPSLRFGPIGVFVRYNMWDTKASDTTASERTQIDAGVNYWPHEQVVIKADIQKQDNDLPASNNENDGFNLGVGYMF